MLQRGLPIKICNSTGPLESLSLINSFAFNSQVPITPLWPSRSLWKQRESPTVLWLRNLQSCSLCTALRHGLTNPVSKRHRVRGTEEPVEQEGSSDLGGLFQEWVPPSCQKGQWSMRMKRGAAEQYCGNTVLCSRFSMWLSRFHHITRLLRAGDRTHSRERTTPRSDWFVGDANTVSLYLPLFLSRNQSKPTRMPGQPP